MPIGIQPYKVAQSGIGLLDAELLARQQMKMGEFATKMQKGKMSKEFEKDLAQAQEKAKIALDKKMKSSSRTNFLSGLSVALGFVPGWGTLASSLIAGYSGGDVLRGKSKHAQKQARLAQSKALGISKRWENTFLGSKAREYGTTQKDYFGDLIDKADVSRGDLLTAGLISGLTSYATSKITGKMTEGMKGLGEFKKAGGLEGLMESSPELFESVPGEGMKLIEGADLSGLGFPKGFDLEKIVEAKSPFFQTMGQSFKGGLKGVGSTFGKGEGKDILTGLLLLLQQSGLLKDRE